MREGTQARMLAQGFPLYYTSILANIAEAAASLAVDLSIDTEICIADLIDEDAKGVMVFVQSGKVITVLRNRGLPLLVEGHSVVAEEAGRIGFSLGTLVSCRRRCSALHAL